MAGTKQLSTAEIAAELAAGRFVTIYPRSTDELETLKCQLSFPPHSLVVTWNVTGDGGWELSGGKIKGYFRPA